ncbi:hypothetical protein OIU84_025136 [Salix udensis]|uniref:Uncharacterized protein n=1 Tax=Salix udensis TaxID=889485 RepID=A0AAD6PDA5_9ROSI|nr:hypothetical protein OIU84_025136 [Salix udensis]
MVENSSENRFTPASAPPPTTNAPTTSLQSLRLHPRSPPVLRRLHHLPTTVSSPPPAPSSPSPSSSIPPSIISTSPPDAPGPFPNVAVLNRVGGGGSFFAGLFAAVLMI